MSYKTEKGKITKVYTTSSRLYKSPALTPFVLEKLENRKKLESKRLDVSEYDYPDTDELGWDFYNTFLNCDVTKLGINSGKTSTADDNLTEKYLVNIVKKQQHEMTPILAPPEIAPEPLRSLSLFAIPEIPRPVFPPISVIEKVTGFVPYFSSNAFPIKS